MIVPMNKFVLIVPQNRTDRLLKSIGDIGIAHLDITSSNPASAEVKSRSERLDLAAAIVVEWSPKKQSTTDSVKRPGIDQIIDELIRLDHSRKETIKHIDQLDTDIAKARLIGDFDPQTLRDVTTAGIDVDLWVGSSALDEQWAKTHAVYKISDSDDTSVYAVFHRGTIPDPPGLTPFHWPKRPAREICAQQDRLRLDLDHITCRLTELARDYAGAMTSWCQQAHSELKLAEAIANAHIESPISAITGFTPESEMHRMESIAKHIGGTLITLPPAEGDPTPTLLSLPRWIESVQHVYRLIGVLPGYRDPDVSVCFLAYLTLFFAVIVGDAGYGLILILSAWLWRIYRGLSDSVMRLCVILGGATMIWGTISGNWFGSQILAQTPLFSLAILPQINVFEPSSQRTILLLCFVVGASHLIIAHGIRAWRLRHSLAVIGHAGWILLLGGMFFLVRRLVLDDPMPTASIWAIFVGLGIAALFGRIRATPLRTILASLGRLPLDATSCFSDMISYIRLFAVGLATFAVATSFNGIAENIGTSNLLSASLAVCVLFFGHTINLLMAGLAIVVHGVRLNMLEFSSHLNATWSGQPYQPFLLRNSLNDYQKEQ